MTMAKRRSLKCTECGGEVVAGKTTLTFERLGITVEVQAVPARVCQQCGEEFVDGPVAIQVSNLADRLALDAAKDVRRRLRVKKMALALA
jgi:YgiT-type zinc finger domain-containing protein